jgi:ketosteroid isomerase-like protein
MSQENVEIVRTAVEAFRRGDTEALIACCTDDVEWRPALSPGGVEGTTYIGHEGVRQWTADTKESWETFELRDPRYKAVGERVLVLLHAHVRGSTSGIEIDAPLAQIYEISGQKVRRITGFTSQAEALEAAGLSE